MSEEYSAQKANYLKVVLIIFFSVLVGFGAMYLIHPGSGNRMPAIDEMANFSGVQDTLQKNDEISKLTAESVVVQYLKQNKRLPAYYLTKNEARKSGWIPSEGNLCTVLPGKAIGGDYFGNREGSLPEKTGRKYFEADINYNCGRRTTDRIIYSNDGLIYVTKDHYKTFQEQ